MKFSSISKPLAASALVLLLPLSAYGAGLGRLTVNSALGQPFSGEIPILANKAEMQGLTAALASDDAFKEAGVEYLPALTSLHFKVVQRADGQAVLKVTSDKPINDPFLDILVQLNWASGKLVREYTVLLDPPGMGRSQIAAPMEIGPPTAQPLAPPAPAAAPAAAQAPKPSHAPKPKVAAAAPKILRVRPGDTLSGIAQRVQPHGVTLDQTLMGLFDANPRAFVGNNMNRLKVGSRIEVPGKGNFAKLSPAEATKQVQVQVTDWNAYRQRLAGAASRAPAAAKTAPKAGQSVSGQATVKVAPRAVPGQTPVDVLKLSKGTGAAVGAIAKEQALRDAESRTAALKQQIQEMKQLAALKEKALQQRAAATAPAIAPTAPAPAAKPTLPPAVAKAPAVSAPVVTTTAPVSSSPNWYSVLQENPLYWAGGAAILLLGGTLWWMMSGGRRKGKDTGAKAFDDSVMTAGDLKTNTLIAGGASGGSINTGDTSFLTDFSQAGLGNIDTHDVDPIAEAEVYMAYGRDAQAEEILKEALAKTPERQEIRIKLLEIYAARKNVSAFGSVAGELHAAVEGQGPLWDKAAEMGRLVDPDNPLYGGVAAGAAAALLTPQAEPTPGSQPAETAPAQPGLGAAAEPRDLNFGGLDEIFSAPAERTAPEPEPVFRDTASGLDFDLGDLDFGADANASKGDGGAEAPSEPSGNGAAGMDFSGLDLDLDASVDELGDLDEVATKLDLARAYLEMGDKEGAREILQEVIAEGNQEQKNNAQSLMAAM